MVSTYDATSTQSLLNVFERLPDPRPGRANLDSLASLLGLATCAVLCGCRNTVAIARWVRTQDEQTIRSLGLDPERLPSARTLKRSFAHVDGALLRHASIEWLEAKRREASGRIGTRPDGLEASEQPVHAEKRPSRGVTTDRSRARGAPDDLEVLTVLVALAETLLGDACAGDRKASRDPGFVPPDVALQLVGLRSVPEQLERSQSDSVVDSDPARVSEAAALGLPFKVVRHGLAAPIYVLLLIVGEICTVAIDVRPAIVLEAAILLALIHHGARTSDAGKRALLWGFTVLPIIRILGLSLPLSRLPVIGYYLAICLPVLASTGVASRAVGYSWRDLGLSPRPRDVPLALLLIPVGLTLGLVDYLILRPEPLSSDLTLSAGWLPALVLVVSAGVGEEVVFRGLVQTAVLRSLGPRGLVYVAILYAAFNAGYRSILHLAFAFLVALLFGAIAWRAQSIVATVVSHASLAITLFLIAPFLLAPESYALVMGLALLTLATCGIVLAAITLFVMQIAHVPKVPSPDSLSIEAARPDARGSHQLGSTRRAQSGARLLRATRDVASRITTALAANVAKLSQISWRDAFRTGPRLSEASTNVVTSTKLAIRRLSESSVAPRPTERPPLRLVDTRGRAEWLTDLRSRDFWISIALVLGRQARELVRRIFAAITLDALCRIALEKWTELGLAATVAWQGRQRGSRATTAHGSTLGSVASPTLRLASLSFAELIEQGIRCIDDGKEDEAYVCFCKAVEKDPDSARAWFWRAKTGRTLDEIVYCLGRALELDPENRLVAANLALFRSRQRRWRDLSEV